MFKKILAILVSAVLAFSFCACTVNIPALPQTETSNDLISTITSIIEYYSYYDVSEEELGKMVVAAYSMAVGDDYAYYYTEEEFKELTEILSQDAWDEAEVLSRIRNIRRFIVEINAMR
jgi:hypothetical protein